MRPRDIRPGVRRLSRLAVRHPRHAAAEKVAVVDEAFARKFGLGRDAVGKRMAFDAPDAGAALDVEIVGWRATPATAK